MTLIIGHRGVPWEAPENTLASLRLALEKGLDGVEYDLQATRDGDPVLLHDETLDRTTDARGAVAERSMTELFGLDAGSWFGPRFMGEPLPAFEEAWTLGDGLAEPPLHLVELKDPRLVPAVLRVVRDRRRPLTVISFHKNVCVEARDAGLPAMFLADVATDAARRFVRDERIDAFGCGPGGWWAPDAVPDADWPCQRWTWSLDDPAEMLWALRRPLYGFNTNEPDRALALRALLASVPGYDGPPPVVVEEATISGAGLMDTPLDAGAAPLANPGRAVLAPWTAAWCGDWQLGFTLTNPFDVEARVELEFVARGGAFECEGLPEPVTLAPHATHAGSFRLVGGSRSPGPDPRLAARFSVGDFDQTFDATIQRVREARLVEGATRLTMLRESPGDPHASVVVSRRGRSLVVRIEDAGGLDDPELVVRLGPERFGRGKHFAFELRRPHFDAACGPEGLAFNVGFTGRRRGQGRFYRFAGGLPPGLFSGAPGRLRLA